MSRLLMPVALVVVLAWGVRTGVSFAPGGPDTGREVADRLRPGMTVEEAERVVGAPPGDYRPADDREGTQSFGCALPRVITWATYRGSISVVDGTETMPGKPGAPVAIHPDGVIDAVDWSPSKPAPAWWRLRNPLALTAAALAGVLLALRLAHRPPA